MAGVRVIDKATGQEITVSAQEARRAVLQGNALMPEGRVMIKRGTEVLTLDPSELPKAWNQGWDLTDEEEARQLKIRREETDAASTAAGAIEAAASGLTFGLSRVAESALGVDPERMRARAEGLGAAEDVIEMGAGLAGAIATGGTGLLAKGGVGAAKAGATRALARTAGRTLGAPTGAVMRGAAAVERGLTSAVGRTALPAVAKKAIPIAGRGAVEGFAYGVGAEIDESVLGDRELSAEQLLASGFMGMAFGGAGEIGARMALPALVRGGGKVGRSAIQKVIGTSAGGAPGSRAAAGVVDKIARGNAWAADFLGQDRDMVERMTRKAILTPEDVLTASNQKAMARAHQGIAEAVYPEMNTARSVHDRLRRVTNGEARLKRMRGEVPPNADDFGGPTRRAAGKIHEDLTATLDELDRAAPGRYEQGVLDDVRDELGVSLESMLKESSAANTHGALNQLRQTIGKQIRRLGGFKKGWQENALISAQNKRTIERLRPMYDDLNTHLRDEALYGGIGRAATEYDNATSAYMAGLQAEVDRGNRFVVNLLTDGKELAERDLIKLARSVQPGFRGESQIDGFWRVVGLQDEYIAIAKKYGQLTPDELGAIETRDLAIKRMRKKLEEHSEIAAMADDMGHMRDTEGMSSVSIGEGTTLGPRLGALAGGGLGAMIGGPAGAALGAGAGMVVGSAMTRTATTIRALAGIMAAKERVGLRAREAVRRFATGGKAAKRAAAALAPVARRAVTIGAARAGAKRDRESRYKEARTYLAHTMANPGTLAIRMERAMANLPDHAPKLASLMHDKAGKAAQFLASKLPPTYTPPFSDPEDALVDPSAVDKFLRYVEVAEDPLVALERMADGTISVEHAEALRQIYPAIYGDVQRQIVEALAEDQAKGKRWPFERQVQLGILFQMPVVDALRADAQALIQAAHGPLEEPQARPGGRGGRKAPDLSRGRATSMARLEEPLSDRYA